MEKLFDKNIKIIHTPTNIAGQMGALSRAQRAIGYNSYSCSYVDNWGMFKCDECLHLELIDNKNFKCFCILRFFVNAIRKYDVFHFHFGSTLLPRNVDLPLIKALDKPMIMHYWGSDVRQKSIAERKNNFVKVKFEDENKIIDGLKRISKYIDIAIVADYELYEYVREYFKKVVVIRQAIELQKFVPYFPLKGKTKFVIVHAPSDKGIKGTKYVIEAVKRLKAKYEIEFVLVYQMPHQQAKEIYQRADIIVDQILGGTHGIFSVEAMALGKPVICYIREDLRGTYPEELPIVSANPDNIYTQLKMLLENSDLCHELGAKGRIYTEKYHDSHKIARDLVKVYEELIAKNRKKKK